MSFFCVHKQCEIQCTCCIYVDISVYRQLIDDGIFDNQDNIVL